MPKVRTPRVGEAAQIKKRPLRFSYWPLGKGKRRYGLQAILYATSPWAVVRSSIGKHCPTTARPEALAYVDQAEYLHDAATASVEWAAKPLLLYYSFLNLAKAFVLTKAVRPTLDRAHHGLSERLRAGGAELADAYLEAVAPVGGRPEPVFAAFWQALSGHTLSANLQLDLPYLLPQVVPGHRLWCEAADENERFMALEAVQIMQQSTTKELWAVLHLHAGTLAQNGVTGAELLRGSGLWGVFRSAQGFHHAAADEQMLRFEQSTPVVYTHRSSDTIPGLIDGFRHKLWTVATSTRPFREYYLYVAPLGERKQTLPQLLSVYAISYYLSSITRYRPQHFGAILGGDFGGLLREFLTSQPSQFVYLLASEFARREITRPALV